MKGHYAIPINPHRRLAQLLKDLSHKQIEQRSKQLKRIINLKKQKLKELKWASSQEIIQPTLIPTKHSYSQFMHSEPISKNLEYLDQKKRLNILTPNRFYSSQPNVKVGCVPIRRQLDINDQEVVSRKFEEYNFTVDEQLGAKKKRRLELLKTIENRSGEKPVYKYARMKRTLFQKFLPDKYNFYQPSSTNLQTSLEGTSTLKRSMSKSIKMRSPQKVQTTEILHFEERTNFQKCLESKISKKEKKLSLDSSMLGKSRMKTLTNQKNIDSYHQ